MKKMRYISLLVLLIFPLAFSIQCDSDCDVYKACDNGNGDADACADLNDIVADYKKDCDEGDLTACNLAECACYEEDQDACTSSTSSSSSSSSSSSGCTQLDWELMSIELSSENNTMSVNPEDTADTDVTVSISVRNNDTCARTLPTTNSGLTEGVALFAWVMEKDSWVNDQTQVDLFGPSSGFWNLGDGSTSVAAGDTFTRDLTLSRSNIATRLVDINPQEDYMVVGRVNDFSGLDTITGNNQAENSSETGIIDFTDNDGDVPVWLNVKTHRGSVITEETDPWITCLVFEDGPWVAAYADVTTGTGLNFDLTASGNYDENFVTWLFSDELVGDYWDEDLYYDDNGLKTSYSNAIEDTNVLAHYLRIHRGDLNRQLSLWLYAAHSTQIIKYPDDVADDYNPSSDVDFYDMGSIGYYSYVYSLMNVNMESTDGRYDANYLMRLTPGDYWVRCAPARGMSAKGACDDTRSGYDPNPRYDEGVDSDAAADQMPVSYTISVDFQTYASLSNNYSDLPQANEASGNDVTVYQLELSGSNAEPVAGKCEDGAVAGTQSARLTDVGTNGLCGKDGAVTHLIQSDGTVEDASANVLNTSLGSTSSRIAIANTFCRGTDCTTASGVESAVHWYSFTVE